MDGKKEALALVIGTGDESAKFWLKVLTDLRNRGLRQVCVVCCDGLTALPEAIEAVYADAWVQCCVVHLIRNSLRHVNYKDAKQIVKDLRPIYRAATEDDAAVALETFDKKWGARYPMIGELWRRHWERFIPFLALVIGIATSLLRNETARIRNSINDVVARLVPQLAVNPEFVKSVALSRS
jgi:transposase-like protein